jgi:oxygen-independent coproporphyrinogen-3 oxidase
MVVSAGDALGLYISIPFCRSKCTYCNFASGVYPASEHKRYVDRLVEDLAAAPAWAERMGVELPRRVETVYLGGGTPSLLAPGLLARLFAAMRWEFDLEPDAEITVECAPGQLANEMLEALRAAGVNRVSLGVQSFVDDEARASGRLHNRAVALADVMRLRAARICNLNIDLIAGLPGQTFASWQESLMVMAALADAGVPHASVYMLEVDQDSRLGREVLGGGARYHADLVPSDDAMAQMYEQAIETLQRAGLGQYEISNFSRTGMESRHNLRYWERRPYLGLGLDASSMLAAGDDHRVLRSTNTDDLTDYLAGAEPVETAWLTLAQQHEEAWFLGLRLNAGVDIVAVQRQFGAAMAEPALMVVARLAENGLLTSDGKTVRLTARGRLLSNDVFQEFLGMDQADAALDAGTASVRLRREGLYSSK